MRKLIQRIILTIFLSSMVFYAQADVADFIYSRNCQGSNVVFVSKSTVSSGSIVSWRWDFDNDGNFTDASGPKVFHVFANPGNYPVGLRITNSGGGSTTTYKTVVVNPIATPNFNVSEVCFGNASLFTDNSTISSGSIGKYKWDFDNDGVYDDSSAASLNYSFTQAGSFSVGHEVVTDSGCISSVSGNVIVNHLPSVSFAFDKTCLYDTTEFTTMASVVSGYISKYHWNFNGDMIYEQTTTSANNTMPFISSGNYLVQVQAESNKGCKHDTSIVVTIAPRPVLNFTFLNFCENNQINIDNSFSNAKTYMWDFGDGTTSTLADPEHIYSNAGIYKIQLTGSSALGCNSSIAKSITIYPTPTSSFSGEDVCLGTITRFTNASLPNGSPIKEFNWDFGDFHGEISENPRHMYVSAGLYNVHLIVSNHFGCRDTSAGQVNVWALPAAHISYAGPTEFCDGDSLVLDVNTPNGIIWSNGKTTNSITAIKSGRYRAIVYDDKGCFSKDSVDITVHDLPVISVSPKDTSISLGKKVDLLAWGAILYNWTPKDYLDNPDISNPTAFPLETTVYQVTGENQFGCKNSENVNVVVDKDYSLNVNNLFSPNGDGVNDVWDIGVSLYSDNEVVIYNRWGVEVFRQQNYEDNWDAIFKGEPLPEGAYYYMIKFENSDKVYSGSVTILR